jgi:hypothetical protein
MVLGITFALRSLWYFQENDFLKQSLGAITVKRTKDIA